jgi:hypothetical protein
MRSPDSQLSRPTAGNNNERAQYVSRRMLAHSTTGKTCIPPEVRVRLKKIRASCHFEWRAKP